METDRIIYAIPSYRRAAKQKTLAYLRKIGVEPERIVISTQIEDDYEAYSQKYKEDATVIYHQGNCVADNRNTIMQYAQDNGLKRVVFLDDDISCIDTTMVGRKNDIMEAGELDRLFGDCFTVARRNNCVMFGISSVTTPLFKKYRIVDKALVMGYTLGVSNFSWRFDRRFAINEDSEACIRMISRGMNVLRFDFISARVDHKTDGGCSEWWKSGEHLASSLRLVEMYPEIATTKPGHPEEVRLKIKPKNIWNITTHPDGPLR